MQKLRTNRLTIGFAIPLVLMVILVLVGLYSMAEIQLRLKKITQDHNVKTSLVTDMYNAGRERTISLYRMITLDDPFDRDEEFLKFNRYGAQFANARIALLKMKLTPEEAEILNQQGQHTREAVESQNLVVELSINEKIDEAIDALYNQAFPTQDIVMSKLLELQQLQKEATSKAVLESTEEYERARALMVLFSVIAVLLGLLVASVVIRRTRTTEAKLYLEREKALVTLHSIGEGVITTDARGNIDHVNPVAEELTGWSVDEAKGLALYEVFHIVDGRGESPEKSPVAQAMADTRIVGSTDYSVFNKTEGKNYSIEYTAAPIRDFNDSTIGSILVFRNVTDIKDMAQQMSYQASHDALTGLINRAEFTQRLSLALSSARNKKRQHVLCYMDLDQFKVVNDTCGHVAGDELLKQLVKHISAALRDSDTLARLGGDEFGLLLTDCELDRAQKVAESIRAVIKDYRFTWEDKSFTVGASFGLVAITPQAGTITDLLSAADSACYVAKELGRDRIHVYQQDDKELSQRQGEMQWLPKIQEALEKNLFQLYCQQIIAIDSIRGDTMRAEILVRMRDADGSIIPPMAFIPAAERYHLMPSIDRWVIQTALAYIYQCQQQKLASNHRWAINLSGQSICDDEFLNFIVQQLETSQVDPSNICFEITETAAVSNLSRAAEFITILKRMGCHFSLDDFGSGLSSFTYLKNLPVDYLKIDGSFVKDMLDDPIDLAMVKSINQIGHTMGLETIAEFVENEKMLNLLQSMRVDFAQGYGVHKPEPIDDYLNKMSDSNRSRKNII